MNVKQIALIGVAGGAVVVWIAGASTSRAPVPALTFKSSGVEVSGARLASEVARLRERLRPTAVPMQSRDLFRYAAEKSASQPQPAAEAPVTPPGDMPAPALKLVGIAEDPGDAGPVRTAIISGPGSLFIVKEGEIVMSRYRVTKVSSDGVELTDSGDNSTLHLVFP